MNSNTVDKIRDSLNLKVVESLLRKYFSLKGINEDRQVNPASIQDMQHSIPELGDKIEIEPHAVELDIQGNSATVGWNLFVLGNQRIYLGETYHNDIGNLTKQLRMGRVDDAKDARKTRTTNQIISFILSRLENSKGGYVHLDRRPVPNRFTMGPNINSSLNQRVGGGGFSY